MTSSNSNPGNDNILSDSTSTLSSSTLSSSSLSLSSSNLAARVLVVGGGGREHALCWKLAHSPRVESIYCAPGNGGTRFEPKVQNVDIAPGDFSKLIAFAKDQLIDLTVIGPDNPLSEGIVDAFQEAGLRVFGPTRESARLEWSKAFAKEFMSEVGIPTPRFLICDSYEQACDALKENQWARVIKADGLALGKGVFVCDTEEECLEALDQIFRKKTFGAAGERVLLEEKISGFEISLLMFCDGTTLVPMPPSQDHKRRFDHDKGPNTGGMGVYAPMPGYERYQEEIEQNIIEPLRAALRSGKLNFKGIIYAGIIYGASPDSLVNVDTAADKPRAQVLEFNARFGDPETQALLPLLTSDLYDILYSCTESKLSEMEISWSTWSSCCVVAAAKSYPESSSKGKEISIGALPGGTVIFHAGTEGDETSLKTNGGRVLALNSVRPTLQEARDVAYAALTKVEFEDMDFRKDIARRALEQCLST
jgi:phosphoribosylamine--glycine ligase